MTWVRIDEEFPEHPKLAQVGPVGLALQVAGLAYCNRNLTDGFVPFGIAETLLPFCVSDADGRRWQLSRTSGGTGEDITARWVIGLLLAAGIWEDAPGGYLIHDFDQYQPPREAVLAEREASRERQRKARERRKSNGSPADVTDDVTDPSRRDSGRSPSTAVAVAVTGSEPETRSGSETQTLERRENRVATRSRDEVFETLATLDGIDPHHLNAAERGKLNRARRLATETEATPDQILQAADNWVPVMGDATRTALGVMSNLQRLLNGPARSNARPPGAVEQSLAYADQLRREGR